MLKRIPGRAVLEFLILLFSAFYQQAQALPVASFTANQNSGCLPLNVQFTSTSSGAVAWYWNLGNGNSSTLANPSNLYTSPGTFTVTLIAYDAAGNTDTARYVNFISVSGKPTANFSVNITTACPDNNIFVFTNTSNGGATSYLWDFGDGTTSTQTNPSHSFTYAGTFTVTLIASNTSGCQDIKIQNQLITISPKPNATVTASSTSNCDPATVFQFSNNSNNGVSWLWSFGDNTSSTIQNPGHSFPGPGNYSVSVIVTNSSGCRDTSKNPVVINVGLNHWADFTQDVDNGCTDLVVTFNNTNTQVASSYWNFGDGTNASISNPTHTYTSGGDYSVSLIVTTTTGCIDTVVKNNLIHVGTKPSVNFQSVNSSGCAPLAVQFQNNSTSYTSCVWYFGDGTTSTAVNPVHVYTNSGNFSVTLQCQGSAGCSKNLVLPNHVSVTSPQAIFNGSPRIGCPPLLTSFNSISQSGGLSYYWNFGDGGTSTLANPTHLYSASGNFNVTLIVTDALGCHDTIIKSNYVQTVNPAANYIPPPTTTGCAPLTAQFTDGAIGGTSWLWDFGDGITSSSQNPVHTYLREGIFTVSLTTTSAGGGCAQSMNNFSTFNVQGGKAKFLHTATVCPPYIASFTDSSVNAVSWVWDFGDGTNSTLQNPSHTYNSPGYHSVSLTITTAGGCTYTTMQSNSVYFPPFGANYYGVPQGNMFPNTVDFYANSVGATSWLWDFGDGDSSTLENPQHIFLVPGNYNVTLTISNGVCSLSYNPPPFIFGQPDSSHIDTGHGSYPEVQSGCAPLNVFFTNRINGSVTWNWDFGDGQSSSDEFPFHVYNSPGIFSVTLTATDTLGIVQVLQMDSIVHIAGPQPGFAVSQTSSCTNTMVTVTDTSYNAVSWKWNLGDGTNDMSQNLVHVYNSSLPNYIITQTVTDTAGCTASLSTSIFSSFVSPMIASENEICGHDTVEFFTSLQNYQTYVWDFGDGQTSTQRMPSHMYVNEGIFTVSLTVTDFGGCSQTFYINPAITVKIPNANFSSSGIRQGCNEVDITFINNSTNVDSYQWNLGDGNISSYQNPQHTYSQAGIYDVSLTVYRGACINTVVYPQYIRVDTAYAEFIYTTDQICSPVTASFIDQSTNAVSWFWNFGDGDTSTAQSPVHTYYSRPCCNPVLMITDINGCKDTVNAKSLPVILASYTTSGDSGCFPFPVQFNNTSNLVVDTWYWDFGDGTTSTLQNPSHVYSQPGIYDVMFIVKASGANCSDTLLSQSKIVVRSPHADFISTDVKACAPSLVNFTNLSSDGDAYLWDFGDGTTSTNINPSHIYNIPGNYNVKLVTKSKFGCADSILRSNYILVQGPITNFTASSLEGCFPFEATFTNQSINAVSYSWNFGDGNTYFSTNASHVFSDTGSFTVSLVTSDTAGCYSFYELPQPVIIHPSPLASFTSSINNGCQPVTSAFTNTSTGYQYSVWHFGDGDTSITTNVSHSFNAAGIFDVQLIAYNGFGCNDTGRLSQPFEVYPMPVPQFSVSDITGCSPLYVLFTDNSTNLSGPQYLWNFGNGQTSTDANPAMTFTGPGLYTVSVFVTNISGCSATFTYPSQIRTGDTIPPNETKILSVSVLSNTSVKIIWENVPDLDLASYVIYRSNPGTNGLAAITTITNVQNTNFALTTEYIDTGLNTLANTYTYKVQALDTCSNSIPLARLIAHTTINVSSQQSGTGISVSWTPYAGCPVSSYQLFRAAPGEDFSYVTTVSSDTLHYLDTNFVCPVPYAYKIMATDLCGNVYTSYSDTSLTYPLNTLEGQIVDVIRSTVVDNATVLTEWKQPVVHPEMVASFDIYRSVDNSNFFYLQTLPSVQTDFMDYDVDVQNKHYYYKILVANTCNISEDLSGITSTIILKGEMNELRHVHLGWTPYEGWDTGVDYYILEKKDADGHWQIMRQVDGNTLNLDFQE